MRRFLMVAAVCCAAFAACAKPSLKERLKMQSEQALVAMLPTNTVREAMGFFAPVTKKYLPVFERFNAEYLASTNRMAVVVKYLPKAEAAYRDARAMKVPAKYEAKKREYLRLFDGVLSAARVSALFME